MRVDTNGFKSNLYGQWMNTSTRWFSLFSEAKRQKHTTVLMCLSHLGALALQDEVPQFLFLSSNLYMN